MINATLCSTNGQEPWAANVDFEVHGAVWTVQLSTKYAHYKNMQQHKDVVVVYKTQSFEIIAKGVATLSEPDASNTATATIVLNWLRLVENGTTTDYPDASEIERIVHSHTS